jgi:acetoin utilization deacetylase AcuC-like enzyme
MTSAVAWREQKRTDTRSVLRRVMRRQWRRLRNRFDPPRATFVYDPAYARSLTGLPHDPLRADRILAFLCNERLISRHEISLPRPVALKNVLLAHTAGYLDELQQASTLTRILGVQVSELELDAALDLQRLMVGGTIQATRVALATRQVAVNLGGGFHHAGPTGGMGYCVFNDVVIAIKRLRANGVVDRVLVVDLDLHDGNGTRAAFANDDSVHTYSIHNQHWGDTAAVADTSIELGREVGDELYLATLTRSLPAVIDSFRPQLVVYLAGCDVAGDDRIGDWRLSAAGILSRDCYVVDQARAHQFPLVVLLAGGYGDLAWRYSARFLSWLLSGHALEPPDNEELTLVLFRQIKSTLDPAELTGTGATAGWQLTEEDLAGMLPGMPRQTRFLDYFSKVGVELLLERFGILQLLRARGFRTPYLHLDLDHMLGQTLQLYTDSSRRQLLVEMRVNRSRRLVPSAEVLVIEWLLLQDPTASFASAAEALPGQSHPGLGLLREFFGWLVVVCEALVLDGTYFRPSHYHISVLARRFASFLDPRHEAIYRAVGRLLGHLPLRTASQLIEDRCVIDATTDQPLIWQGFPMVVPTSDRLQNLVAGTAYEAAVAAGAANVSFRLADQPAASQAAGV